MDEEMLKAAFKESCKQELEELEAKTKHIVFAPNDAFKKKMNRLYRERLGIKTIPHPEVDTAYERVRSAMVRVGFILAVWLK